MGPAASSDKADGRSLPVQIPKSKEQMAMRTPRRRKREARVWGHTDKHTHTVTLCTKHVSLGKVKHKELIKTIFFLLETLKCPRDRDKGKENKVCETKKKEPCEHRVP